MTPELKNLLSQPLTPDMKIYVENLPVRHPDLFTQDEQRLLSLAVQNSNYKAQNNG